MFLYFLITDLYLLIIFLSCVYMFLYFLIILVGSPLTWWPGLASQPASFGGPGGLLRTPPSPPQTPSLTSISEPTRLRRTSSSVLCLPNKNTHILTHYTCLHLLSPGFTFSTLPSPPLTSPPLPLLISLSFINICRSRLLLLLSFLFLLSSLHLNLSPLSHSLHSPLTFFP